MFRIIKWIMRIIFALLLIGSLALNVGILMIGGVAAIASNVIESVIDYSPVKSVRGTKTVYSKMNAEISKTTNLIVKRTVHSTTRDLGAMVGQSIPYIGVAAIVGATVWDLQDSCDTVTDLQELHNKLGFPLKNEAEVTKVCGLEVPSKEEVWQSVKDLPKATLNKAKEWIDPVEWQNWWFKDEPDN